MSERFDIERILMNTHNRFLMQPGYENTKPFPYRIYIENKGNPPGFYVISANLDSRAELWHITGQGLEEYFPEKEKAEDPAALSVESPCPGKVIIKFENRVVKKHTNYDDFWQEVSR